MPIHRKGAATAVLAQEYADGATTVEIAAKYGMHHTAVNGRLRRAGFTIRLARKRCVAMLRGSEVIDAYRHGFSVTEIIRKIGGSRTSIRRVILEAGLKMRPCGLRAASIKVPKDAGDIGYLAGLFDGEGNLQIRETHNGASVACKIAIYSTTPEVMDWLSANIGGKVLWDHARTVRHGWKPIGSWQIYRAQDAALLLRAMLPRLIIKKTKAELAMEIFAKHFCITELCDVQK